ncbi:unnamed protein product, partial [Lampetra planeri]
RPEITIISAAPLDGNRANSVYEEEPSGAAPTPPVRPRKEPLKPNLNINNHNSTSIFGDDDVGSHQRGPESWVLRAGDVISMVEQVDSEWFDFEGEHSDELSFSEGDVIQLKAYMGEEWAQGQIGVTTGIFPLNFVEVIEDLPQAPSQQQTQTH